MGVGQWSSEMPQLMQHLEYIGGAQTPAGVVQAVQRYLDAWPRDRVERLQRVDGGWAPFDMRQRASRVNGIRDLRRLRDAVHRHCAAMGEAGIALTPELVELDEVFFIAAQMAERLEAAEFQTRSPAVAARTGLFAFL